MGEGGISVGIDDADHALLGAGVGRRAVEEDGSCIVYFDTIRWRFVEDGVYGFETRPEACFAFACHLVGYARVLVFRTDDRMVLRVEVEFDYIANFSLYDIRLKLVIPIPNLHCERLCSGRTRLGYHYWIRSRSRLPRRSCHHETRE